MYTANLFTAVVFSQFSACHNGLDLLAKMAKKHQHSLHGVKLLRSDCEPDPESVCLKALAGFLFTLQ